MRRLALAMGLLLGAGHTCLPEVPAASAAERAPDFADFATGPLYGGHHAHPDLDTSRAHAYRSRLSAGAAQPVNFASHYSLIEWGCGTSCVEGAIVDLISGKVSFIPFTVTNTSEYDLDHYEAIEYRSQSSLIVFRGQFDDAGPGGTHYFFFDGKKFQPISENTSPEELRSSSVLPTQTEIETCQKITEGEARLKCYDAVTGYHAP